MAKKESIPSLPPSLPGFLPLSEEEIEAVTTALREAPITTLFGGYEIDAFEQEFARLFGADHAVAVTSGTTALHAALMALDVGPGDEVVVTPFSFVASVSVVVQVGAVPVFADVDGESLVLDPADVARKITDRTRAILPVHQCGYPVDIPAIQEIIGDRPIAIVEDCAAAHGARIGDRYVGTLGELGCFSFNIGKIMRTGEGGMVLTGDAELARRLRAIRVNGLIRHPAGSGTWIDMLGSNFTMTHTIAAIGRVQVRRFHELSNRRREISERLARALEGLPVRYAPAPEGFERAYYSLPLIVDAELEDRCGAIVEELRSYNVPVGTGNAQLLHQIDFIRRVSPPPQVPVIERVRPRVFFFDPLPVYTDEQVTDICRIFRSVIEKHVR